MKGLAKRFVNQKGKAYEVRCKPDEPRSVQFLDLWRYSTVLERVVTLVSGVLASGCSLCLIAAVLVYGELTSFFVQRHKAEATTPHAYILHIFNGGRVLPEGNRSLHMDALLEDSLAFGLASIVIMVIQFLLAAVAVNMANWASYRMVTRLRCQLLRNVIRQEIAFFDTNTTLNFATTITEDIEKLQAGTGEHVVMSSYLGGTAVCGCILALLYGWQLTLAGMAIVPIALMVAALVAKYQTKCSSHEVTAYGKAGRVVEEALSAIRTVRAYGGEEVEVKRYVEAMSEASKAARRRGIWAGAGAGLGWMLTYLLNTVIFAYGVELCVRDLALDPDQRTYHPGVMVTVLFCSYIAAQNIALLQPHLELFSAARGAACSIFPLLARQSKLDALAHTGHKPSEFKGDVVIDNVYFNYPSRPDVKVLRGFTLKVNAGETVALVGGSGCGKSTVLQLLQRLYEPDAGNITVDGHCLQDLHLHHYRTSIGVVGQEPVLFAGTIRDNITLGLDNVKEEDLIAAAKLAHAHQFIMKLVNGYDTMIGERGCSLSGGQKQRVAIARAVLRKPAILLLDEPTSALDPNAERQVQAALDAASEGRTTIVVSHRLATIRSASRIVVVAQGAVLEQGSHAELEAARGAYWDLLQQDLTSRSITKALGAEGEAREEDIDVDPEPEPSDHFQRAFIRQSTKESLNVIRGSMRCSAHVGSVVPSSPDVIAETEESSEDMSVPSVTTMQLLRLNAAEWPLLLGGGVAAFLVGASMPVFALLFSKLYGMFSSSDGAEILRQSQLYSGLFGATAFICGIVCFLQVFLLNRAGAQLTERLRMLSFRNFLRQDQGWFDLPQNSVGALSARLGSDCAAVQGATGTRLGTVLQGFSTMAIGVALSMAYSWKMTLVSLVSVPFVIGGIYLEAVVTRERERTERMALSRAAARASEAVTHVRTVHTLGVEETLISRYEAALAAHSPSMCSRVIRGAVYGLCLAAPTVGYTVSLSYAGYLIARDNMQYEYAILVSEALVYGAWMLAEALSFAPNFAAAQRAGARVIAALAHEPTITSHDGTKQLLDLKATGEISLDSVTFHYPTRAQQVLRGLSLRAGAGRTLALVGASGCGKSTVMQLLLRNYDPDGGKLELDGKNIKQDLTLQQLRSQFGLVQQEPMLFDRTIRENIAYGDNTREVPLQEIIEAAKKANVHSFIASLPMGYETRLGGGGCSLSGGQKQRVAIARALLRDPRVLLLDEATSALDASSEQLVQAALAAASAERSTLVVAHRLATVRHAHAIAVIDKGVVAEIGTHEELIQKRGLYWELWQQQAPASSA